jgi:transposase
VEQDPERAAAMMLGLGDSRVLGVGEDADGLLVEVETSLQIDEVRCPTCHGSVVLDGTEELEQPWPPSFGRPTVIVWMLRRFRCENTTCPVETFAEEVPPLSPA